MAASVYSSNTVSATEPAVAGTVASVGSAGSLPVSSPAGVRIAAASGVTHTNEKGEGGVVSGAGSWNQGQVEKGGASGRRVNSASLTYTAGSEDPREGLKGNYMAVAFGWVGVGVVVMVMGW